MKEGFTKAMQALSTIQYDEQKIQDKLDINHSDYDVRLKDVVSMVIALKVSTDNFSSGRAEVEVLKLSNLKYSILQLFVRY